MRLIGMDVETGEGEPRIIFRDLAGNPQFMVFAAGPPGSLFGQRALLEEIGRRIVAGGPPIETPDPIVIAFPAFPRGAEAADVAGGEPDVDQVNGESSE